MSFWKFRWVAVLFILAILFSVASAEEPEADPWSLVQMVDYWDGPRPNLATINSLGLSGENQSVSMAPLSVRQKFRSATRRISESPRSKESCIHHFVNWGLGYNSLEQLEQNSVEMMDPLVVLGSSVDIVRGEVRQVSPAWDFASEQPVTVVFLEILQSYKGAAVTDGEIVAFMVEWGRFEASGFQFCYLPPRSIFFSSDSLDEIEVGQEMLLGFDRYEDVAGTSLLAVSYAHMFRVEDGVAKPFSYVPYYSAGEVLALDDLEAEL